MHVERPLFSFCFSKSGDGASAYRRLPVEQGRVQLPRRTEVSFDFLGWKCFPPFRALEASSCSNKGQSSMVTVPPCWKRAITALLTNDGTGDLTMGNKGHRGHSSDSGSTKGNTVLFDGMVVDCCGVGGCLPMQRPSIVSYTWRSSQ